MNWNPMFCAFLSVQYWTPCLPALLRLFESFCWFLMVFFWEWSSRRFLELLLVHSIVASEILASFESWNCERCVYAWIWWFWYVFFGVVLVSVDDAFWSVFLIFDANLTHLIYHEWETRSFLCALWSTSFFGNTAGSYCRWRCCFSVFLWFIAPHASSLCCDQSILFVGICRFDFRDRASRWFLDIFLIHIQKSSR